jgi:hypothetical protein
MREANWCNNLENDGAAYTWSYRKAVIGKYVLQPLPLAVSLLADADAYATAPAGAAKKLQAGEDDVFARWPLCTSTHLNLNPSPAPSWLLLLLLLGQRLLFVGLPASGFLFCCCRGCYSAAGLLLQVLGGGGCSADADAQLRLLHCGGWCCCLLLLLLLIRLAAAANQQLLLPFCGGGCLGCLWNFFEATATAAAAASAAAAAAWLLLLLLLLLATKQRLL